MASIPLHHHSIIKPRPIHLHHRQRAGDVHDVDNRVFSRNDGSPLDRAQHNNAYNRTNHKSQITSSHGRAIPKSSMTIVSTLHLRQVRILVMHKLSSASHQGSQGIRTCEGSSCRSANGVVFLLMMEIRMIVVK